MILARNFEVELKPGSEKNAQIISKLQQGKLLLLGPLPLRPLPKNINPNSVMKLNASTISMQRVEPAVVEQVIASKPQTQLSSASLDMLAKQRNIRAIAPDVAGNVRAASFGTFSSLQASAVNVASINPTLLNQAAFKLSEQGKVSAINPAAKVINRAMLDKLIRFPIETPPIIPDKPKQPEEPSNPIPEPAPSDSLQIIAFICERLPKSPNPDSNLKW
jgi:hypothetical protein